MRQSKIIERMCKSELSQADIKAICKFRGFSSPGAASAEMIETLITSDLGLESAFDSLTQKEIVMLHLLIDLNVPVDISIFGRISSKPIPAYGTFNRKYGSIFTEVKKKLVRKGLAAFCRNENASGKTKLEQTLLCVPLEFKAHLPGLFKNPIKSGKKGNVKESRIRKNLEAVSISGTGNFKETHYFHIDKEGHLKIGDDLFTIVRLKQWQHQQWKKETSSALGSVSREKAFKPIDSMIKALSRLDADEWIEAKSLKPVLKIFCNIKKAVDADAICQKGWQCGILAQMTLNGKTCYRLNREMDAIPKKISPTDFLTPVKDGVRVDVEKIPLKAMDLLSGISFFRVKNGVFYAVPNPVMIGRKLDDIRKTPLLSWLVNHADEFGDAFKKLEKNWGKQILHRNLLIAKIGNIGLRATLEKKFSGGKVFFLPNDFIAFPANLRMQIEQIVVKNGFAVKIGAS